MADDLSLCWRPGCDTRSSHKCWACDHGKRRQGLPQARKGQPNGRLEVLYFFRLPGLPFIKESDDSVNSWEMRRREGDMLSGDFYFQKMEVTEKVIFVLPLFWWQSRDNEDN